jgi:CRISPR/Cas system-associated exonuclease Cas4 (RecB family)
MKLYLKDGNTLKISENLKLEILNMKEFILEIKENSKSVPTGHFKQNLKYKLVDGENEYLGETICDSYNGFIDNIDDKSPYKVELINWNLADNEDNYIEFNVNLK